MEAFEAGSAADGFGGLGQQRQDLLLEMYVEVRGETLLGADSVLLVSTGSRDAAGHIQKQRKKVNLFIDSS